MKVNSNLSLPQKAMNTIDKYRMLKKGERVIAALSGGADSVCLVLLLRKLGFETLAVHVNHQLRGEESERDEDFCRRLCEKLDVPLFVRRVEVKKSMAKNSLSLETAARELRYQAFAEAQEYFGGKPKIATAHNADDCLETAIFNLLRGSGAKGLCGVPPVRENFVRPLCETTRAEIEDYLRECGRDFVTDSTNLEADCSRNIIRLRILPLMKEINSGLVTNYLRLRDNLSADEDYLAATAATTLEALKREDGYDVTEFEKLHPALKNRACKLMLEENEVEASALKISELAQICENGGKINLKKNLYACCKDKMLKFETENSAPKTPTQVSFPLENIGEYSFMGRKVRLEIVEGEQLEEAKVYKKLTKNLMDYDKIKGIIVLRNRRCGDRFTLCGNSFSSKVKKLFNAAFAENLRDSRVLLEADGEIIFLEGFGASQSTAVDELTKRGLRIIIGDVNPTAK